MAIRRLTKSDATLSFGVFNPVGHVVLAFESDRAASDAAAALRDDGFDDDDVLQYSACEEVEKMTGLLDRVSGVAGFGHEVGLMRLYKSMAEGGCGWLLVYAPDDAHCRRVLDIAKRHGVKLAEKYHRLVIEDLI